MDDVINKKIIIDDKKQKIKYFVFKKICLNLTINTKLTKINNEHTNFERGVKKLRTNERNDKIIRENINCSVEDLILLPF